MTNDNILVYYWKAALSRWKLLAGVIFGITLLGWAFSALILAQNPKYEAFARINVVPTSEELGYATRFARGQNAEGTLVLLQTYAEYARSRDVRERVVDRWIAVQADKAGTTPARWLESQHEEPSMLSPGNLISWFNYGEVARLPLRDELVEELGEATTIESIEGTFLMEIAVEWDTAVDAAWFANGLTSEVMAQVQGQSEQSGENLADVLRGNLETKKAQLAELKDRSRRRKIALGVVDIDRQKQALLDEQIGEQSRLTTDMAEARRASAQVSALRAQANGKLSPTQTSIEEQLALEQPKAAAARQSISTRQNRINSISGQLKKLASAELSLKTLDDDISILEAEVAELTQRLQFSETENLTNRPQIRLLDEAQVPALRSSPKILINTALSFIAGCALAGMLLLLLGPKPAVAAEETVYEPMPHAPDEEPKYPAGTVTAPAMNHADVKEHAAAPEAEVAPQPSVEEEPVAQPRYVSSVAEDTESEELESIVHQPIIRREPLEHDDDERQLPRFMKRTENTLPRPIVAALAPAVEPEPENADDPHEDADEAEVVSPVAEIRAQEPQNRFNVVPINAEQFDRDDRISPAVPAMAQADADGAHEEPDQNEAVIAMSQEGELDLDELNLGNSRMFVLPAPEDGTYFSAPQVGALSAKVLHWLWLAIVADGTIDIYGTADAAEANGVAKLVMDSLAAEGISVRALRAGSPAHAQALRKPDGSVKLIVHHETASELPATARTLGPALLVVGDDVAADTAMLQTLTDKFAGEQPYVAFREGK